jgi:CheY-like chemotaxis protein
MLLSVLGHETEIADNGLAALKSAESFQPDIIFLDIGLPGMSGYEVARQLRSKPTSHDVTLIAVTGWGSDKDRLEAKNAGFNLHITKPMELDQVERVVNEISQRQGLRSR